jgi:hypothetical protein
MAVAGGMATAMGIQEELQADQTINLVGNSPSIEFYLTCASVG